MADTPMRMKRREGSAWVYYLPKITHAEVTDWDATIDAEITAHDLTTKSYVDGVVQGLDVKQSVLALKAYGADTTSPNYGLTGLSDIDGVTPQEGSRILVTDVQSGTAAKSCGIWIAHATAWTRALDFAVGAQASGTFVFVEQGTTYMDTGWVCTTDNTVDAQLVFTQFSAAGLVTVAVDVDTNGATPLTLGHTGTTYTVKHSTKDGFKHVTETSTTNAGKALVAGATAGTFGWGVKNKVYAAATDPAEANITIDGDIWFDTSA